MVGSSSSRAELQGAAVPMHGMVTSPFLYLPREEKAVLGKQDSSSGFCSKQPQLQSNPFTVIPKANSQGLRGREVKFALI